MKKLPKLLFSIACIFIFFLISSPAFDNSNSQAKVIKGGLKTTVSATVGDHYLSITGYIAPFASIILTSDGVYLRATTADENGYFSFTEVLIKAENTKFCFEAVDFKNYGKSYSCITIKPSPGTVTVEDVFLPPTLGLYPSEINEGSSAVARGYSMPGAKVILHVGDKTFTTQAGADGYYQFTIKDLKAGTHEIWATAELSGKKSLEPTKKLILKVKSIPERFFDFWKELLEKLIKLFTSISLGPLWLAIPILILIIILLKKLFPGLFTSIFFPKFFIIFPHILHRKKKHLHHEWWVGY